MSANEGGHRVRGLEQENARLTRTIELCRLVASDMLATAINEGASDHFGASIATLDLLLREALRNDDPPGSIAT